MARVYSFKWAGRGYVAVSSSSEGLIVDGGNLRIVLSLREIEISGVYEGIREHLQDQRGTKKVVYIDLAFPIKGLDEPKGTVFRSQVDLSLGAYGLSYTPLEPAGTYITIYPPPGSLYDYAVIAYDKIALFTIGRRQVYVMEEMGARKVIMV